MATLDRIPFLTGSDADPLRAVLERMCRTLDCTPEFAAAALGHLFIGVTEQLEQGRVVYVPGFGAFGTEPDGTRLRPTLAPARPLRLSVESVCSAPRAAQSEADLKAYDARHRRPNGRAGHRAETALLAFIEQVAAEARKADRRGRRNAG